ncbi:MAG: spermidine synthase [Alphaproteobacteria bacterium]
MAAGKRLYSQELPRSREQPWNNARKSAPLTRIGRIRYLPALFSATLFLSAALMFSLQPMIGKMLLPIVGGAPSGWLVAVAFFQLALLVGYCAAHFLSRVPPLRQAVIYLGVVCLGSIFLPVTLAKSAGFMGDVPGPGDVLLLLTITVGVPFMALSATSSTLQRLFAVTDDPAAANPYFLYVASNLGSFTGLLLYPLLIEPTLRLTTQAACWLFVYLAMIVAIFLCLFPLRNIAGKRTPATAAPVALGQRIRWVVLAFVPSSLMMGLTTYTSTEIVSMPLLWVIPLGLYLLTFVVAFSDRKIISLDWLVRAQPVAVTLAILPVFIISPAAVSRFQVFGFHAVVFTLVALMCHMLLARSRPASTDRDLTLFYLLLALGGALGGVFNAFIAPVILKSTTEYPAILIASCLLSPAFRFRRLDILLVVVVGAFFAAGLVVKAFFVFFAIIVGAGAALVIATSLLVGGPRAAIIGCGLITISALQSISAKSVYEGRNFYGVLKVYEQEAALKTGREKIRFLSNGTTLHGKQSLAPGRELETTSYYTKDGPLGDIFTILKPHDVAAIGLGVGTIACYGTPESNITFFEINPLVRVVAEEYFSFLEKCSTGERPGVILGDARLSLSRMADKKYDLIILDAFSSDSVPTHLLTREAITTYMDRLAEGGVVLFHISNRHFFLAYPLLAAASAMGLESRFIDYTPPNPYADQSQWVAMARDDKMFLKLTQLPWRAFDVPKTAKFWTDDYNNLFGIMHL